MNRPTGPESPKSFGIPDAVRSGSPICSLPERGKRWTAALLLLITAGCGDDDRGTGRDGGPRSGEDGAVQLDGGSVDAGPVEAPFGLEERPANPTCLAPEPPPVGELALDTEVAFEELGRVSIPIFYTEHAGRSYVVEKGGRIVTFTGDGSDRSTFVDISRIVDSRPNEAGLLGLAFHPNFEDNGYVFLSYTTQERGLTSHIARFESDDDGVTLDPTPTVFLRQPQFAGNHNGGWIGFGPDGFLYIAFGDGGGGGDPRDQGQNPNTFLGSMLRIDVDRGDPYGIPPDNPFADGDGGAPEVFAWGLRNPWRVSFDSVTGDLWAGDVGQGALEEVDIIELGGNYGWNEREGNQCFVSRCRTEGLIEPVAVYGRDEGRSITGGYVYRGSAIPELIGVYVFADYSSGFVWGLFEQEDGTYDRRLILDSGLSIASFGQDEDGEIYAIDIRSTVRRLVSNATPVTSEFPARLSDTGCMDASDTSRPGSMLIPYAPTATLWSDEAGKERWLAIPDDMTIQVNDEGDFDFPAGTVLVKQFRRDGRLLETRLYMRHPDERWAGYTYRWNDEQTDAFLLQGAGTVEAGGRVWNIPSRAECQQCHTAASGRSLGLEVAQLNALFDYPTGRRSNQLETLEHIGVLEGLPETRDALAAYGDEGADVALRARGYLHSNCASCHRPDGPGRGELDLRYSTALEETGVCRAPELGDLGIDGAQVVAAGEPGRSVLLQRTLTTDRFRMPQIGTALVDDEGTGLLRSWIESLAACE